MTKIPFSGSILVIGCGAVSQCLLPLLLRHLDMDYTNLTIMDFEDNRGLIADILSAGAKYVQQRVTPDDLAYLLDLYTGPGDMIIDLAWNIGAIDILQWCHDNNVMYINTSVELWNPYFTSHDRPVDRTLYVRHLALRDHIRRWSSPGATAVVEHGANPGLVSHWTKVALRDITLAIIDRGLAGDRQAMMESALDDEDYARLAMFSGTKVIHVSERDTQIGIRPKEVNEFVNTWSVAGFHEEGIAPAEMGWGTHEQRLPQYAHTHTYGPCNQICLAQMGINTYVRSWVPSGEIIGMVVRHGESFTISDHLTVWDAAHRSPMYRPTVHYAYLPTDAAMSSLHELKMRNYELQDNERIMHDEIISGRDELGVLLLGHDLNGWWVGSQLDIEEARKLAPHQNATTLQVAASVLGAIAWMIRNPRWGVCVPDDLPFDEVLAVAAPYLGTCLSIQTDWNPLQHRNRLFDHYGRALPPETDMWQFDSFRAW